MSRTNPQGFWPDRGRRKNVQKPVIPQSEGGRIQLVDGFHRCKALEQAAGCWRSGQMCMKSPLPKPVNTQGHRDIAHAGPRQAGPLSPEEPAKADGPEARRGDEELPENLKIP